MTVSRVRAIKVPPYSVHSEKVVLGSMIAEPALIASICRIIPGGETFFRPEHGRIFDAVIQMHQRHKPATTKVLLEALEAHGLAERLGGESLLHELGRENADPAAAADQAQIVANKAKMRRFIDAISDSLHDAYYSHDDYEAVLERTQSRLRALKTNGD